MARNIAIMLRNGRLNRTTDRADRYLPLMADLVILSIPSIQLYLFFKSIFHFALFNMWWIGSVLQILNFEDIRSLIRLFLFAAIYLISPWFFNVWICVLSFSFIFYCMFSVSYQYLRLFSLHVRLVLWNDFLADMIPFINRNAIWEG
jgi:hypothetical protein